MWSATGKRLQHRKVRLVHTWGTLALVPVDQVKAGGTVSTRVTAANVNIHLTHRSSEILRTKTHKVSDPV